MPLGKLPDILLGLGFWVLLLLRRPSKLMEKKGFAMGSDNWWLKKMMYFCFLFIFLWELIHLKKQIDGPENDHATRKSPGHFAWVRALNLSLLYRRHFKLMENRIRKGITHIMFQQVREDVVCLRKFAHFI
jgi:hypothetical protein